MKYYSPIKRNEVLIYTTWISKIAYYGYFICNTQKKTNLQTEISGCIGLGRRIGKGSDC